VAGFAAVGIVYAMLVVALVNRFASPEVRSPEALASPVNLLVFTVFALTASFVEEMYYRGLLFPMFRREVGMPLAMLIVTMWFGAVHFGQVGKDLWVLFFLAGLGLMTAVARQVTKVIGPSIALHMAYNATVCLNAWLKLKW
jgi:membrane protease YdiL (CAAX protease family)